MAEVGLNKVVQAVMVQSNMDIVHVRKTCKKSAVAAAAEICGSAFAGKIFELFARFFSIFACFEPVWAFPGVLRRFGTFLDDFRRLVMFSFSYVLGLTIGWMRIPLVAL